MINFGIGFVEAQSESHHRGFPAATNCLLDWLRQNDRRGRCAINLGIFFFYFSLKFRIILEVQFVNNMHLADSGLQTEVSAQLAPHVHAVAAALWRNLIYF